MKMEKIIKNEVVGKYDVRLIKIEEKYFCEVFMDDMSVECGVRYDEKPYAEMEFKAMVNYLENH